MDNKIEQKPLIVEAEAAKMEIIQSINNALQVHRIPCYFIDMMLTDICCQIKELAKQELSMANASCDTNIDQTNE